MTEGADDGLALEEIADCAWLLRFDDAISREVNERVHAAARALRSAALPGVVDIVPAYSSLAVVFDEPTVESRDALAERVYELAGLQRVERRDLQHVHRRPERLPHDRDASAGHQDLHLRQHAEPAAQLQLIASGPGRRRALPALAPGPFGV